MEISPIADSEGPDKEYRKSSTFSLTSVLNGVDGYRQTPAVYPGEFPGTHLMRGWEIIYLIFNFKRLEL
jgi:hypothetical protein